MYKLIIGVALVLLGIVVSSAAVAQPRVGYLVNNSPVKGYVLSEALEEQFGEAAEDGGWLYTCLIENAVPFDCFELRELVELRGRVEAIEAAVSPHIKVYADKPGWFMFEDGELITGKDLADIVVHEDAAAVFIMSNDREEAFELQNRLRARRNNAEIIWIDEPVPGC